MTTNPTVIDALTKAREALKFFTLFCSEDELRNKTITLIDQALLEISLEGTAPKQRPDLIVTPSVAKELRRIAAKES